MFLKTLSVSEPPHTNEFELTTVEPSYATPSVQLVPGAQSLPFAFSVLSLTIAALMLSCWYLMASDW